MKQLMCILMVLTLFTTNCKAVDVLKDDDLTISVPSACLIEKETGTLLYEKDAHTRRPIASVTKVMTLLLIMEEIEAGNLTWDDQIVASSHAASMGGSQIWLEEGESMPVSEMVKCITVVSANDCSVAMAEHISGSEEAFAAAMNQRAQELGLQDTHFMNCTGLFDAPEHYSSAYDVAILARELISHEEIKNFTTIWTDTARDGELGLSNTNKLIRFYDGATGLKTGFTNGAKYCLAATAMRDGTEYIAVVLGGETSNDRFDSAKTLLNHAFANYVLTDMSAGVALPPIPVELGKENFVQPTYTQSNKILLEKAQKQTLRYVPELLNTVEAPITTNTVLGTVTVYTGEQQLAQLTVTAAQDIPRLTIPEIFLQLMQVLLCAPN